MKRVNPFLIKSKYSYIISQILFYVSFWGYLSAILIGTTTIRYEYKDIYELLLRITWLCVVVSIINIILFTDYKIDQLLLYTIIAVLLYISYGNCGERMFLQSFLIVLSARKTNWKNLIKNTLVFYICILCLLFLMYFLGITYDMNMHRGEELRYTYGIIHPNTLGHHIMVLAFIWVAVRYKVLKWFDYFFVGLMAVFTWSGPHSRTSFIMIVGLLILMFLMQLWNEKIMDNIVFKLLCILCYPVCLAFSLLTCYFYNEANSTFVAMDQLLSNRVRLGHQYLQDYYHTWFGQKIVMIGSQKAAKTGKGYIYLDSAYMRLYVSIGIIGMVIAILILMAIVCYCLRQRNWGALIGLLLFAVYGISETSITYLYRNVFLILFAYIDFPDIKKSIQKLSKS